MNYHGHWIKQIDIATTLTLLYCIYNAHDYVQEKKYNSLPAGNNNVVKDGMKKEKGGKIHLVTKCNHIMANIGKIKCGKCTHKM